FRSATQRVVGVRVLGVGNVVAVDVGVARVADVVVIDVALRAVDDLDAVVGVVADTVTVGVGPLARTVGERVLAVVVPVVVVVGVRAEHADPLVELIGYVDLVAAGRDPDRVAELPGGAALAAGLAGGGAHVGVRAAGLDAVAERAHELPGGGEHADPLVAQV